MAGAGAISSPGIVCFHGLNAACCNLNWLSPRSVAFKLDIVYSDSPSSLYSFCVYGVLGSYPPAIRA